MPVRELLARTHEVRFSKLAIAAFNLDCNRRSAIRSASALSSALANSFCRSSAAFSCFSPFQLDKLNQKPNGNSTHFDLRSEV